MHRVAAISIALLLAGCYTGHEQSDDGAASGATDGDGSGGGSDGGGADGSGGDGGGGGEPVDVPSSSVARPLTGRLNDVQYANSVLDILGVEVQAEELLLLPRDIPVEGDYSTAVSTQFFNAQYVLAYAQIARSVVSRLDPQDLITTHGECNEQTDACLAAFTAGLGRRLFRRPLSSEEQQAFEDLATTIGEVPDATFEDAVVGVTEALLQSPGFLYKIEDETEGEPDDIVEVNGYELATRLSYFLWQSAPDGALLDFADGPNHDGAYDRSAVAEQIDRMMDDPKFERSRRVFWGDYSLASIAAYVSMEPELAEELRESLLASFDLLSGVGAEARPMSAVFDTDQWMMTPAVAELAGAEPLGDGLQVYDVSEADVRLGMLTHPGFLAAIGTTSFVGRGVYMTERFLCQHIAPPPDNIEEEITETAQATEGLTPRQASEFRFGLEPICLGCHTQFEPIAYGFERYDLGGRYTLTDEEERPLYSDGVLPAFGDREEIAFESAPELLSELAGLEQTQECFVENMMQYATGAGVTTASGSIELAKADFLAAGETFEALVRSVALNRQMTFKRVTEGT